MEIVSSPGRSTHPSDHRLPALDPVGEGRPDQTAGVEHIRGRFHLPFAVQGQSIPVAFARIEMRGVARRVLLAEPVQRRIEENEAPAPHTSLGGNALHHKGGGHRRAVVLQLIGIVHAAQQEKIAVLEPGIDRA